MIYGTIVCVGDSLTHGARDEYRRCYPMELSDYLSGQTGQHWICAEEGVNGETSADVLRRMLSVVKKYPEAYEFVLLVGMNDSKDYIATPTYIFEKNVLGIVRITKVYNKLLYLCTVPLPTGFGAPDYSTESIARLKSYNKVIRDIASQASLPLVELEYIDPEYFADGVHLTNYGNKCVARQIGNAILSYRTLRGGIGHRDSTAE